jgi:uncharacterized membrane protein YeaQ/YmgE (transglycosylase-associated protein family)
MTLADPLITFLIVVLIGIVAGLLAQRYFNSSWILKQLGGRRRTVTSALVGIAGAFIGFHIGALLGLGNILLLFITAAIGAALVLWGWKELRI